MSEVALDGTVDAVETAAWQAAWSDLLYSYTEPDGTEMNIRNIDVNAKLLVEKVWQDENGNVITDTADDASVEVSVYQVAESLSYTKKRYTVEVYCNADTSTPLVSTTVAEGTVFTLESVTSNAWVGGVAVQIYGKEYTWSTEGWYNIDSNWNGVSISTAVTQDTRIVYYDGSLSDTVKCYVIETFASYDGKVLAATLSDGIVLYAYYSDSSGNSNVTTVTATDSSSAYPSIENVLAVGAVEGLNTVTITNQVQEEEKTTFVSATKTWASSIQEASVTFTLIQLLVNPNSTSDSDKWITVSGDNVVVNASGTDIAEYTKTIDVTKSADVTATWSDLPTKATYNGESYECAYFIAETKVTNGTGGTGTDITGNYEAAYTYLNQVTSGLTTYTADSIVYYQVTADDPLTVTNTAQESVILPMTGGLGADRIIVFLGCGLALLAVCIFFVRRRILCGGGDCET